MENSLETVGARTTPLTTKDLNDPGSQSTPDKLFLGAVEAQPNTTLKSAASILRFRPECSLDSVSFSVFFVLGT